MKNLEAEIFDNDEILGIVDEIREDDRTIKGLKKDYPNEIEKLEEVLLNFIGENNLKFLKTELPKKSKFYTKELA